MQDVPRNQVPIVNNISKNARAPGRMLLELTGGYTNPRNSRIENGLNQNQQVGNRTAAEVRNQKRLKSIDCNSNRSSHENLNFNKRIRQ